MVPAKLCFVTRKFCKLCLQFFLQDYANKACCFYYWVAVKLLLSGFLVQPRSIARLFLYPTKLS